MRAIQRSAVLALGDVVAVQGIALAAHVAVGLGLARGSAGAAVVADAIGGWPLSAVVVAALALSGGYRRGARPRLLLLRVAAFAVAVILAAAPATSFASLLPAALLAVLVLAFALGVVRFGAELFVRRVWPGRSAVPQAIFVGSRDEYRAIAAGAEGRAGRDHRIVAWLGGGLRRSASAWRKLEALEVLIEKFDAEAIIVGASVPQHHLHRLRELCLAAGCELLYPIPAVRLAGTRARVVWRYEQPYLAVGDAVLRPDALVLKRIVDLLGAAVGLVLLAPLLAAIALCIRLDSPGSVLFVQDRAGFGGARFRMLKFRTMRAGADDEKDELAHLNHTGDPRLFKIPDDPRVTRFGRWLRRWSLDELPQLWNVLVGDMSLVGPRPFFARDLAAYEDHHFHRLGAKPGITGLWQVSGRSTIVDFEEVVRLDREYIEGWSVALDLSILARTVPAVLGRSGAY